VCRTPKQRKGVNLIVLTIAGISIGEAKRVRSGERTSSPGQHPLGNGQGNVRPQTAASLTLVLSNQAKEAVPFVGDSSSEKDSARLREKIPQAIKLERCTIGAHERLDEIAGHWIVNVN